jgi:hypothetical protein
MDVHPMTRNRTASPAPVHSSESSVDTVPMIPRPSKNTLVNLSCSLDLAPDYRRTFNSKRLPHKNYVINPRQKAMSHVICQTKEAKKSRPTSSPSETPCVPVRPK